MQGLAPEQDAARFGLRRRRAGDDAGAGDTDSGGSDEDFDEPNDEGGAGPDGIGYESSGRSRAQARSAADNLPRFSLSIPRVFTISYAGHL
jgi:hypothetical protein